MSETAPPSLRAEAQVDLDAIRANVVRLRVAAPNAEVMAVVKAEGYGHGLVPSALAALDGGATWLGVAVIDEALELREAGITAPVLAWLLTPEDRWAEAVAADVDLSVASTWGLERVADAAREAGRRARVHLKVDTGLGRGGATPADWSQVVDTAHKAEVDGTVEVVGLWSHFAYADEPTHPTIAAQLDVFRSSLAVADEAGLRPLVRHIANSAATLTLPDAHFDLVRPGIAVYGVSPGPAVGTPHELGLRPAMRLSARIASAKRVQAGHGVSYGHQYHTAAETTLGLVPLGYADGVPRNATNVGPLLAAGKRRTVAGRVCMDQLVVDVGDDPLEAGDEVVLFGAGDDGEPTAHDWAEATGTIAYEIVTRIGARVPRTYVGSAESI